MTDAFQLDNGPDAFTGPDVCFYIIDGDDEYKHSTAVEVLAELVDATGEDLHPGLAASVYPAVVRDAVDELGPTTVMAMVRVKVDDAWLTEVTGDLVETFRQRFADEYGSSEVQDTTKYDKARGGIYSATDRAWNARQQEAEPALLAALTVAVREHVEKVGVYRCKDVAERTYSADEMWSMLCVYYGFEGGV